MNHIYRSIWNYASGTFVAASELVKSNGPNASTAISSGAAFHRIALKTLSLCMLLGFGPTLHALPTAGVVTAGNASISNNSANSLTVTQTSPYATLNWQSFNVGVTESVKFVQPDSSSVALNRVVGSDPSRILGNLTANGKVFLVNPYGILFGKDASVNVGGLVASALDISDADFVAGRYRFEGPGRGEVSNLGTIHAEDGGYVALLGNRVGNEGTVTAKFGTVSLAAGNAVTLDLIGDGLLNVIVDKAAANALASNGGLIQADGGAVLISAQAKDALLSTVVNTTGIIQANSVGHRNGRIVLDGGDSGVVQVGGELRTKGTTAGTSGGTIVASGDKVLIADEARLDASGDSGGGAIYVGGGWQGQDPGIRQASGVYVSHSATLDASATQNGNGGTVVAWSDIRNPQSSTRVYGSLLARGGVEGGDGGRIETSGHWLDVAGIRANAAAPRGKSGQWLLDPEDLVVGSVLPTDATCSPGPFPACLVFTSGAGTPNVLNTDIEAQLNLGTGVVLQTAPTGGGNGDISINANITQTGGGPAGLMLNAAGTITMSPGTTISSSSGSLDIFFNGAGIVFNAGSNLASNGGNIGLGSGGNIVFNGGSSIASNGGNVGLIANGNVSIGGPVSFTDSVDIAAAGSVTVNGGGSITTSAVGGYVSIQAPSFINNAGAGAVTTSGGAGARWIIYSNDPSVDTFGGLSSGNQAIWGQNSGSLPPGAVPTGNRYVFATPAVVTVTTTSPAPKPFGQTISVASNVTYSGAPLDSAASYGNVYQDLLLSDVLSTLPTVTSAGTSATASVAGSPYPVTAAGGVANSGFSINYVNSGLLVIDQAVLDIMAIADIRTYSGQPYSGGNGVTYSGFLGGDNASVLSGTLFFSGSSQGAVNAGQYFIVPNGLASNNYSIRYVGAPLTIKPKEVTVTGLLADNKEFDGNSVATIRNWGSVTTGVGQESLLLEHGDASFSDPNVGVGKTVTVDGYRLANGNNNGLASNYVLKNASATTTADIVVAGRSQTVQTVQATFNALTGSTTMERWRDNFDLDPRQTDLPDIENAGATPTNDTPAVRNASNSGAGKPESTTPDATAAGSAGLSGAGTKGAANTRTDSQNGGTQGTSRFSTPGFSGKPAAGKLESAAGKPVAPEKVFLKGAAIASAVGSTSSRAVLVATVVGSGKTTRMAVSVAAGEGFEMTIPKSLFGNTATHGQARPIQALTLSGGPLPTWITFNQDALILVGSSVPSTGLPLTIRLAGSKGKFVEVTFK